MSSNQVNLTNGRFTYDIHTFNGKDELNTNKNTI